MRVGVSESIEVHRYNAECGKDVEKVVVNDTFFFQK